MKIKCVFVIFLSTQDVSRLLFCFSLLLTVTEFTHIADMMHHFLLDS